MVWLIKPTTGRRNDRMEVPILCPPVRVGVRFSCAVRWATMDMQLRRGCMVGHGYGAAQAVVIMRYEKKVFEFVVVSEGGKQDPSVGSAR